MQSIDQAWAIDNDGFVVIAQPKELLQNLFRREVGVLNVLMLGTEKVVYRFCAGSNTGYCISPTKCDAAGTCLA